MQRMVRQMGLSISVSRDYEGLSRRAAQLIIGELEQRPDLLLCASAGATPTRTYELLAGRARRQPGLFRKLRVLQIDEWAGLPLGNPARCDVDLERKLLAPMGIGSDRYAGFRSDAAEPERECRRISTWLARHGPIDICILGLGTNGHVAMNEPADAVNPQVHVAKLARSSQQHPMLRELKRKPRYGLTLGIGDILRSRKILLLANGQHKAGAVKRLLQPRVANDFPASFLWLHSDANVLCDRSAAPSIT